jgi:hypothetical protein
VNRSSGLSHDELLERAAQAIVREWSGAGALGDCTGNGVTVEEARAAVKRNFVRRQRLGTDLASLHIWADLNIPAPREPEPLVIDLTDWAIDPGWVYFYGRVEC